MVVEDDRNTGNSSEIGRPKSVDPTDELGSLQATNAKLVDTLQQLQRERAGDALEGVLGEVDRTISGMLTYVEDLRRTREKLVRGVQSVADRLAEIDSRAVLGTGTGTGQPSSEGAEGPQEDVLAATTTAVDLPDIVVGSDALISDDRPPGGPDDGIHSADDLSNLASETQESRLSGGTDNADDSVQATQVTELIVHGCTNLGLVAKLQATLSSLDVVQSLRIRQFHRETLMSTVAHCSDQLANEVAGLEIDGRRLSIVSGGDSRIEASFI